MKNIKDDFPLFKTYPNLIYLDNGATTQKPQVMIDALVDYYSTKNSNIGRGFYKLAETSEDAYIQARKTIAQFVNTLPNNIVFTKGTTESINQVVYIVGQIIKPQQKIILSVFEHHANILCWQRLAKEKNLDIIFIEEEKFLNNPNLLPIEFWNNVAVIALSHVSNVTGQVLPISIWGKLAQEKHIIFSLDGAQGIVSEIIDLNKNYCDFYSFSGHKLYGPMGTGVLYLNNNILDKIIEPQILGGGIIDNVQQCGYELIENSLKFEAGTPNVADIYALAKSIEYLQFNNWKLLLKDCHNLNNYLINELKKLSYIYIIEPQYLKTSHITSFVVNNIHAHDIGTFLANKNIAVRVGKHCTYPLHCFLKIKSSVRVSLGIYNTKNDVDVLIIALKEAQLFFKE